MRSLNWKSAEKFHVVQAYVIDTTVLIPPGATRVVFELKVEWLRSPGTFLRDSRLR